LKSDRNLKPAPSFVRIDVPTEASRGRSPAGYDGAGIYVRDLPQLRPAAEAARAAGLRVNEDVIQQVEALARAARLAVLLLSVVVAVLGGLSFWNVKVIQELRALHKTSEIGMLKAIGMSDGLLRQVYLAEATLVWGLGVAAGAALGLAAGPAAGARLGGGPGGGAGAFYSPWDVRRGGARPAGCGRLAQHRAGPAPGSPRLADRDPRRPVRRLTSWGRGAGAGCGRR